MFTALVIIAAVCIFLAITAGLSLAFWDQEPEEPVRVDPHPIVPRRCLYNWENDEHDSGSHTRLHEHETPA